MGYMIIGIYSEIGIDLCLPSEVHSSVLGIWKSTE